ncbi:MAG: EAL domain-containing protein [Pseudobutyrivibrio sp.]|nr:EAL domain-containing protein [Pseudobutyrivibrio sp.]
MNIYTQVCGLVIVAMLIFFYKRQPTMGLNSERRFKVVLFAILGCVLCDIASCYFIVNASRYTPFVVNSISKVYLLFLQVVAFSTLAYELADIFEFYGSKLEKMIAICYQGICIIGLGFTLYLPIEIYYDGDILYTYGAAPVATYCFVGFYVFSILLSLLVLRRHIKPTRVKALSAWMCIWTIAAGIQFVHPQHLIVSFASCLGALIMYFEIENPQSAISRKTGHFSSGVIREYFDNLYQNKKKFSLMMISFRSSTNANGDTKLLRKTSELLSEFLFSIDSAKVFDTAEGYFLLVFDNMDFVESTKFRISTYFQSIENNPDISKAITLLRPFYTIIPNGHISSSADELLLLLASYSPNNQKELLGDEIILDDSILKDVQLEKLAENHVIEAMENDRIEVHYQPIYDIATEKFTSAEALVRIRTSGGKLLYPDTFIPIVEETGRIIPLSDAIYRKTLSFMKSYHVERLGVERIELNLSVRQGEHPLFVNRFMGILEEFNINPDLLNLEITETNSLHSKENLLANMKKLEEYGLSFSLDDFGSGSSNLNYMIEMPVGIVKLDRDLSGAYFKNDKAQAIVKAVIAMAHSMNIKLIAEGIETKDEFDTMKTLGVDYIQGFYFSRPLPEHEFLKFMQEHNL